MQTAEAQTFHVTVNGERVEVTGVSSNTTLLDWLRCSGRVGTKCGCNEGDCGACTVAMLDSDAHGRPAWRSVNSCIALLPMFAGREIVTVEGLAARGEALHPVQRCMVDHYGSQCGYCTPGFVMSLFEGYHRPELKSGPQIADQLCGNLCRCTGYRAIRDAAADAFSDRREDRFSPRLAQRLPPPEPLAYATGTERFMVPTSLAGLLALRARHPEARLIAGATEIGVEINKRNSRFPFLISTQAVPELLAITATAEAWHIGAAASLTAIEEALGDEIPALSTMLRLFAARQIRNRATLGGNLVTGSPIGDSAPLLLALDATLCIHSATGSREMPLSEFFLSYRRTALAPDEVLTTIVLPRIAGRRTRFFKVAKRREMDISIVSAACSLEIDADGIVQHARIAYGGVAACPARALAAEEALLGRSIASADGDVRAALEQQYTPIDDVRGSAAYRRGIILGLWEKLARPGEEPTDEPLGVFTPGREWAEESPSRALRHESAIGHVTGRARFVDDTAQQRPMLTLWPVTAPHAHARILRRDATAARRIPGVVAVLFAEDIPGENDVGVSRKDESLLACDEVLYHGHMVAIVVGETTAACRLGAAAVVVEYEPLPAIVTIQAAIAAGSFHTDANFMRRGDVAVALTSSPEVLHGELEIGGQEHFYLETHAAWAEVDPEGNVFVSSSTQHPSEIQTIVADVLAVPRHRVVVEAPRMGGGFGGKETQGNSCAALVALAALRTGRPVRVQLDRDVDMQLTGKRHPFHASYSAGYDGEGRLLALRCALISNGGWSLDLSLPVTDRALFHLDNAYYIPAVEVSGRVARTHLTSQTAFRGFGGPQGMLVIEEILARIASRLDLAPETVRERNLYHGAGETNTTHYGEEIGDNRIQDIWHQLKTSSDFAARRAAIRDWNAGQTHRKRGLAITPVKFGISFTYTPYNQAGALVLIYRDGSVQVNHGGTEMGQGLQTKILGIAMRELGLAESAFRLMSTATDKVPNTSATAASSGSDLNGAAVQLACVELRARLLPQAISLLRDRFGLTATVDDIVFERGTIFARSTPEKALDFQEVVELTYMLRISLSATGYYATPGIHWDRPAGKGRPFAYFACGAAVSEVEVDGDTGMSTVRRVDILHDAGASLNPGVDRGQIEGGFVQGMGWLTREDLRWDARGVLQSHSASTYQIPAFSDAPQDFRVALYADAAHPAAIHGSKGIGEPPLMLAISVREAIRAAIAAFSPAPTDIPLASPATGEAVFRAITQARA